MLRGKVCGLIPPSVTVHYLRLIWNDCRLGGPLNRGEALAISSMKSMLTATLHAVKVPVLTIVVERTNKEIPLHLLESLKSKTAIIINPSRNFPQYFDTSTP